MNASADEMSGNTEGMSDVTHHRNNYASSTTASVCIQWKWKFDEDSFFAGLNKRNLSNHYNSTAR